jgi:hypothetical protein
MNEPARNDTIENFTTALVRSQLVDDNEVAVLVERYRSEYLPTVATPDTITAYCNFLVTEGVVTPWQIGMLRLGKWKGFFLDEYVFVDMLGATPEFDFYLVRNTHTGKYARLAVTPREPATGPEIEYHLDYSWEWAVR